MDGPPRIPVWSTWSGPEGSSQCRFPEVPRVRLVHLTTRLPAAQAVDFRLIQRLHPQCPPRWPQPTPQSTPPPSRIRRSPEPGDREISSRSSARSMWFAHSVTRSTPVGCTMLIFLPARAALARPRFRASWRGRSTAKPASARGPAGSAAPASRSNRAGFPTMSKWMPPRIAASRKWRSCSSRLSIRRSRVATRST